MSDPARQHLYLAGFMGTGKSTIGPLLAQQLGRRFYDLDDIVETSIGKSIDEVFSEEGEMRFREYEARALESLIGRSGAVVALGGGAPTVPRIAERIRGSGYTILLTADWETIWRRVKDDRSRPLLRAVFGPGSAAESGFERFVVHAGEILDKRRQAYEAIADWTIDTSALSSTAVVRKIIGIISGADRLSRDRP